MAYESSAQGEIIGVLDVKEVAKLPFGSGKIGRNPRLESPEDFDEFSRNLSRFTVPLSKTNTADCGDERRTLRLADGTIDASTLNQRIVPQLFGGLGLATTKAAVAANAGYLRNTKSFWGAYLRTNELLSSLGYEDGGHAGCGSSTTVESSVAQQPVIELLRLAVASFAPLGESSSDLLLENKQTHEHLLGEGYFGDWNAARHEAYLAEHHAANFSFLAADSTDHETYGHHGKGVYIMTDADRGFAKNSFIEDSGDQSFGVTLAIAREVAHKLGGSAEERHRIELGYYADILIVGNVLMAEGMPIFAQTA